MNLRSAKKSNTQPSKPQKTTSPALLNLDAQPEPKELPVKRLKGSNKKIEIIQKTKQHRIPSIGPSNFKVCREKGPMVDKTEFIKEFIENPANIIAALFPRRFGKSTNLNMVQTFVEVESDENGSELEDQNKSTPPYFLGGKIQNGERLESMAISNHKAFVEKYMGKFPTISVDFKELRHGNDFESIQTALNNCIYKEYERHSYLEHSSKLFKRAKGDFTETLDSRKIPNDKLPDSLQLLSNLLFTHWGKKVFVFIDEYDAPINYVFWKVNFKKSEIEDVIAMFSEVFSNLLKTNDDNIEKALITGILHIEQAGFLSELNNIVKLTSFTPDFGNRFYGFLAEEVKILMKNCGVDKKFFEQIKEWYNGYLFGGLEIYNPWAIVNCISKLAKNKGDESFLNYWESTGSLENCINLLRVVKIQFQIKQLINNCEITFPNVHITNKAYQEIVDFSRNKSINFEYSFGGNLKNMFLQMLFHSGYFTLTANGKMKIPNKEIKEEFALRMRSFFETRFNIDFGPSANVLAQIFEPGNQKYQKCKEIMTEFCKKFDEIMKCCPPFLDIKTKNSEYGIHPNEDIVHSLLNVICLQIAENIHFGTEIYCFNQKRCDILMTKKSEKIGAIIEVKFAKTANEALDQIIDKKYIQGLPNSMEIKKRILIGLNITKHKKTEFEFQME